MHSAIVHLLSDVQPVPVQQPLSGFPPNLYTHHNRICYGVNLLGSAGLAVFPPNFLCTLSLPAGRVGWEAEKSLTQYKHLKHECVATINLILNPKWSAIPATRKKTISVPPGTRTEPKLLMKICATPGFCDSGQQIGLECVKTKWLWQCRSAVQEGQECFH